MKFKQYLPILFLIFATGLAFAVISAHQCRVTLTTKQYTVEAPVEETIRIVQLSDLHGQEFGADNCELVELVRAQSPDLILMTGDMLDKSDENANVVCRLIESLIDIAPVYYGYGNHETSWESQNKKSLQRELTEAGAVVLELTYADVEVNGQALRLGGYSGYYGYPGMLVKPEQWDAHHSFYADFEDTDRYRILLCHIPTSWLDWGDIHKKDIDLVLTGHYHGGQIRIPFVGGLYAPYIGLFPKYTEGLYRGDQATCILSTGLGSSPGIPRINNLPQVVVVDLVTEK